MEQPKTFSVSSTPAPCGCLKCLRDRKEMIDGQPAELGCMVLCGHCGNKRCPHATDHYYTCTGSNEPGQLGSAWEHAEPLSSTVELRNKILVVMPSRGRPESLLSAAGSLMETSDGYADLLIVTDRDDPKRLYTEGNRISTLVLTERIPMLHILNKVIPPLLPYYLIIGFTGDDVRYATRNWDTAVWNILRYGIGIVYGDDGIQGENLPTHPWFSADIVRAVGYVAPPCLQHFYFDNYLKGLGQALNMLHWQPNLRTDHRHYSIGGIKKDQTYRDGEKKYQDDRAAFARYEKEGKATDVEKIRAYLKRHNLTVAAAASPPDNHKPPA